MGLLFSREPQDPPITPPDVPEPDTCGNCRYCVIVDSGVGCEHAAICVRVYEDTADYGELLLVDEEDVACEGFWEVD